MIEHGANISERTIPNPVFGALLMAEQRLLKINHFIGNDEALTA
jgi:hypothetical protein